jgi:hypothetical protein
MRWSRWLLVGVVLGALVMIGCGINEKETITLKPDSAYEAWGLKVSRAQTMTISVAANPAPVDVYIVLENDKAAAKQALETGKAPTAVMASKAKVTEASFDNLAVPANTQVTVFVVPAGKQQTEVKLKATGK